MSKDRKGRLRPFTRMQRARVSMFIKNFDNVRHMLRDMKELKDTASLFLEAEQIEDLDRGMDWVSEGLEFLEKIREPVHNLVR